MPLSLEHFKLLNAKANSFDRGTGGVPDITFQEVADALATVELLQEPDFMHAEWAINVAEHFDREFVGHQDSLLLSS